MKDLEKILEEIEEMPYPTEGIGCGLEDAGITDRYEAAAYGWNEAVERIAEIIRSHMEDDGWIIWDGKNLPPEGELAEVTIKPKILKTPYRSIGYYDRDREEWWKYDDDGILDVIAWKMPSLPYRPKEE
ncbi:hypothetical protein BRYFOR_07593 [Marvinbryantia formatexigens DSM 14469]|uniref:DUF551 domain-containing protein n=1 Tax=Marvinbryantia formatexigens DSM 14469 TaxID=478749 RepID=C6LG33_9FIRM|nr:hypothetical protein [Marvinbryantia formatexigens]EET60397.1 hypothetical protein BRYFOR_07593 [Marvinbryantia formatexigens DSM 14469]UWO25263.1 hypothetical protein NQ534_01865 [Marvinbryantia formatexigens DSM 14469]SDH03809.1 hypothetical protein SAMN05660368_03725 [Marvinbryantia formatexigens]